MLGWFLISAATAEERQAQLRGVLDDIPVSRVTTSDPATVPGTATVALVNPVPLKARTTTIGDMMRPLTDVTTAAPVRS